MGNYTRRFCLAFAAGAAGGLLNSLAVWSFGLWGITSNLGVSIAPALTPAWLYPRIVWGGIWGFLFLLPTLTRSYFKRGLIFSLGPSLVQLFVIFPFRGDKGLLGLQLGELTPLFVLFYNAIWGLTAAFLLKKTQS